MSQQENKMLTGTIWKQILIFFFPILIGTFFQQLYNTVDAFVVGQFAGKEALASVGGSAAQIINFVVGFFTGLTAGGTVLISQYFGGKQYDRLQKALHTSYAFALGGGLILSIAGVFIAPLILKVMNTPVELLEQSTLYVRVYFGGLIFVFIYNMGASILRAIGDSKRPLYFLIICTVINIILDLTLVLGLRLGVLGVAVATLIAQGISAILVTWWLMKRTPELTLRIRDIRLDTKVLRDILKIGLPSGIQSSMYSISNMIVQTSLNLFGVNTVAAWTSYGKVDVLFWMINASFGTAAVTFVGQNYGAGLYHRMRKGTRTCLLMSLTMGIGFSALMLTFGPFLLGIFTSDAAVIEIGMTMIHVITPTYFLFVFIEILSAALRAQGKNIVPTTISILGICVFRIIWISFVGGMRKLPILIMCYPISWAICAIAITIYYLYEVHKMGVRHNELRHHKA